MPTGASDQIPLDKSWECHMNEGWGIRDKTTDWLRGFDFVLEELQGPLNVTLNTHHGKVLAFAHFLLFAHKALLPL